MGVLIEIISLMIFMMQAYCSHGAPCSAWNLIQIQWTQTKVYYLYERQERNWREILRTYLIRGNRYYEVPLSQMLNDILGYDHIKWHPPQWLLPTYMLKIARGGLIGDFKTMFKIQTQTVILLCEQVFTIFLCIGEYFLIEIISLKITRRKLTEVTGPLVPLEI